MLFNIFGSETRATPTTLENPRVSLSDPVAFDAAFGGARSNLHNISVSEDAALGIPAVWQAVNIIASTIASLPFHLYTSKGDKVEKKTRDPLYRVVHDQANDVDTSMRWRKWLVSRLVLTGRPISLILHDGAGRVAGFLPLDNVIVERRIVNNRPQQIYKCGSTVYEAWQVLDFTLLPKPCGIDHYSPLELNRNAIAGVIAAEQFASTLFANGGVPPLVMTGPPQSPGASARAAADVYENLASTNAKRNRNILTLPSGFDLKAVGLDPEKQELLALRQWQITEVARIFNVPPVMLHDLSKGTYSNTEQQNLAFAQHTIAPLCKLIEQEMNSKLFATRNKSDYVEFDMNGLMRGDYQSRMEGNARAVFAAIRTPNEVRAMDNLAPLEGGDKLYIQSATVPIESVNKPQAVAPEAPEAPTPPVVE